MYENIDIFCQQSVNIFNAANLRIFVALILKKSIP